MNSTTIRKREWLPLGWKMMAGYGISFIGLSIFVPLQSYLTYSRQPMIVFGPADEEFTGVSWDKIMAFSPDLGLWLVFTMISMCAMMLIAGVLTFFIARSAYRHGERWAWKALFIEHLVSNGYYVLLFIPHASRGIYPVVPASSGLGVDPVCLFPSSGSISAFGFREKNSLTEGGDYVLQPRS